jgi:hypothetical protein
MKRLALGLGIAGMFVVATATVALANHGMGSGSAVCNVDGTITYTFLVDTSGHTVGDITTRLGNGPTPFTVSETVPGTQTTDSLEWHAAFHENNGNIVHSHGTIDVTFNGTCMTSPTPTPSSTTPPPTSPPPTSPPASHSPTNSPTTHVKGAGGVLGNGGTAPTGSSPTPAIVAFALLITGLGLMWAARRKARAAG